MSKLNVTIDYVKLAQHTETIFFLLDRLEKTYEIREKFEVIKELRIYSNKIRNELDVAVQNKKEEV